MEGSLEVGVSANGVDADLAAGTVQVRMGSGERAAPPAQAAALVESVQPALGDTQGGAVVRVLGRHLQAGQRCSFGTISGVEARWVSGKEVECVSPAHEAGVVGVGLEGDGRPGLGPVQSLARGEYIYVAPAEAVSVQPSSGPARAATQVLVQGSVLALALLSALVLALRSARS